MFTSITAGPSDLEKYQGLYQVYVRNSYILFKLNTLAIYQIFIFLNINFPIKSMPRILSYNLTKKQIAKNSVISTDWIN